MSELKKCPFCGWSVKYSYDLECEPNGVFCVHCKTHVQFMGTKMKKGETFGDVMERIAQRWNKRAGDQDERATSINSIGSS